MYQLLDLASNGAGEEDEEVTFNAFVVLLSVMSIDGDMNKKMLYAFRLIDSGDDGRIDAQDLYDYLKLITKFGSDLDAENQELLLRQAVENTIAESASNGLFITLEDFQKSMFVCDDFAQRFTLNIKKKRAVKKSENYKVKEDEKNSKESSDEENIDRAPNNEEKRKDGHNNEGENETQRPSKSLKDKINLSKVRAINSFSK